MIYAILSLKSTPLDMFVTFEGEDKLIKEWSLGSINHNKLHENYRLGFCTRLVTIRTEITLTSLCSEQNGFLFGEKLEMFWFGVNSLEYFILTGPCL
jgi:hypothetical protein